MQVGAAATGSHGSGVRHKGFQGYTAALDFVLPDGDIKRYDRNICGEEEMASVAVRMPAACSIRSSRSQSACLDCGTNSAAIASLVTCRSAWVVLDRCRLSLSTSAQATTSRSSATACPSPNILKISTKWCVARTSTNGRLFPVAYQDMVVAPSNCVS